MDYKQSFLVRVGRQYSQFSGAGVPVAESSRLLVPIIVPAGQCWAASSLHLLSGMTLAVILALCTPHLVPTAFQRVMSYVIPFQYVSHLLKSMY